MILDKGWSLRMESFEPPSLVNHSSKSEALPTPLAKVAYSVSGGPQLSRIVGTLSVTRVSTHARTRRLTDLALRNAPAADPLPAPASSGSPWLQSSLSYAALYSDLIRSVTLTTRTFLTSRFVLLFVCTHALCIEIRDIHQQNDDELLYFLTAFLSL